MRRPAHLWDSGEANNSLGKLGTVCFVVGFFECSGLQICFSLAERRRTFQFAATPAGLNNETFKRCKWKITSADDEIDHNSFIWWQKQTFELGQVHLTWLPVSQVRLLLNQARPGHAKRRAHPEGCKIININEWTIRQVIIITILFSPNWLVVSFSFLSACRSIHKERLQTEKIIKVTSPVRLFTCSEFE